jgi:2-polyprenyl-3-methyl-5-hydroxy-6-metoxy-1,4-benzoquinol methylase
MEVECPICNRKHQMILLIKDVKGTVNDFDVLYCKMCKVGITTPFPSSTELSSLYSSGPYRADSGKRFVGVVETAITVSRQLRRRRIEKYMGKGRILDIGCGRGVFLDEMRKHGWKVAGTEYNEDTAESINKRYNVNVVTGNPEDWGFPPGSFDVVTMNHVLEHMSAPEKAIDECSKVLREGGLIVLAVPNIMSLQSIIGKHLWFHLDIPYHIYHFSEMGLSSLIEKHGFHLLRIRRFDFEYNPFGWLQTLLNVTGIRRNLLYDLLKNVRTRNLSISNVSKWHLLATVVLTPVYLPISMILSLYESFVLKNGGTMEILARKQGFEKNYRSNS